MLLRRFALYIFLLALSGGFVSAQEYPTKAIRIVSAEAGGGNDFAARVVAQGPGGPGTTGDRREPTERGNPRVYCRQSPSGRLYPACLRRIALDGAVSAGGHTL